MSDAKIRAAERRWHESGDPAQGRKLLALLERAGAPDAELARRRQELGELENVHTVLAAALVAAQPGDRPPLPHHLGGPCPVVPGAAMAAVARWIAEWMRPRVPARQLEEYDELLALSLRSDCPESARDRGRRRKGPFPLASLAVSAALLAWKGESWMAARAASRRVVELLTEAGEPEQVRAFLAELDQRIVLAEAQAQVERRGPADAKLARVIERGGNAGPYRLELEGGRVALIEKVGTRWSWFEGPTLADAQAALEQARANKPPPKPKPKTPRADDVGWLAPEPGEVRPDDDAAGVWLSALRNEARAEPDKKGKRLGSLKDVLAAPVLTRLAVLVVAHGRLGAAVEAPEDVATEALVKLLLKEALPYTAEDLKRLYGHPRTDLLTRAKHVHTAFDRCVREQGKTETLREALVLAVPASSKKVAKDLGRYLLG